MARVTLRIAVALLMSLVLVQMSCYWHEQSPPLPTAVVLEPLPLLRPDQDSDPALKPPPLVLNHRNARNTLNRSLRKAWAVTPPSTNPSPPSWPPPSPAAQAAVRPALLHLRRHERAGPRTIAVGARSGLHMVGPTTLLGDLVASRGLIAAYLAARARPMALTMALLTTESHSPLPPLLPPRPGFRSTSCRSPRLAACLLGAASSSAASRKPLASLLTPNGTVSPPARYSTLRLLIHSIAHPTEPLALSTQLAEIRLYEGGRRLSIASAVAIGGDGPADLGAARAVDGNYNTKWADAAVLRGDGNASILELRLHAPARVTSYELVSADDQPSRDPASWTLWGTAAVSTAAAADTTAATTVAAAAAAATAATADASEWWLLDAQLPYAGRRPGRLSSFGRLPTHGGRAADEAVAFTSWPLCGSLEHLDMPTTAPTLPTTAPNVPSPLMLIDELGAASAAPSLGMQTLGTFEGRVAALVPSAAVAAVTLFESAAFDGRRHTLPMTGVPCRLPPSVRPRVRSLRIQLRSDVARLLYPAGAQHGARTDLATGEMQGQATLGRAAAAPTGAAPTGAAPTVAASATPAATARYLDLDEEVPSVADGATALCLGARVSGALLFPQRAYGGSPLILWRRGGQRLSTRLRQEAW